MAETIEREIGSNGKQQTSRIRRIALIVAGLAFIIAALAAEGFSLVLARYAETPFKPGERPVLVNIGKGLGLSGIAQELAEAGVIDKPKYFSLIGRIRRMQKLVKAGEYSLSAAMTPSEILDLLVSGRAVLYRITVPEGFTVTEIADLAVKLGMSRRGEFLNLCFDPMFTRGLGVDAESLEGYLYPDTYLFPRGVGAKAVITTMVARFFQVFTPAMEKRAEDLGLTMGEAVTLASIIQKESGAHSELPLISSVFHNRLKKGMRLQSDPTVIYGIENFDGNITRRHLTTPTPYNTYTIAGLPPGPIANPGKEALMAALYPAQSRYLFFVSRGNGTHEFSRTLSEHNLAVRNYQLRKGSQPDTKGEPSEGSENTP
ncbi:MAG: endolytic transglycosylase MltG [Thermodesulfobacteriota bacterium]